MGKCTFRDPKLVTFYLCIYLILNEEHFTSHLQYKHSGTFANRKCEEHSYPKNSKMCDPILVTPLKMLPHYSQSRRENATPSSGTSPLASYKKVPPQAIMTRIWDEKNRPRGDNFTNNLQPSLSLQIVTTAPPFQLTMAVFFQVILSWLLVRFLSTRIFLNGLTSKLVTLAPCWLVGF